MRFWKYFKASMQDAKKHYEEDKKKEQLLSRKMDFQYLEEIVQKINENPLLRVSIILNDGTRLELNTRPKKESLDYMDITEPHEEFIEVR